MTTNTKITVGVIIAILAGVGFYLYHNHILFNTKVDTVAGNLASNPATDAAIQQQALTRGVSYQQQLRSVAADVAKNY